MNWFTNLNPSLQLFAVIGGFIAVMYALSGFFQLSALALKEISNAHR